ncbi:MAG: NifB/NifX family molybdenum-iron cluster-binding protein [Mangrovibacterium sp.]
MIAISATARKLTASMDLKFVKCRCFLITDGKTSRFIGNPFCNDKEDAPARVVGMLQIEGVTRLLTGEVGPEAKILLDKNRIQIIIPAGDKLGLQHILHKMGLIFP